MKKNREYSQDPEYRFHPEYTPVYPDSSFFRESAVTMREENVCEGHTPAGERSDRDRRRAEKEEKNERKKKEAILKYLLRSAAYTAAAALAVGCLAAFIITRGAPAAAGTKTAAAAAALQRPAFNETQKYSNAEFAALWRGSEDAPHKYDREHPLKSAAADCLHTGTATYVCLECGITHDEKEARGPHAPSAAVAENVIAPGCNSDGSHDEVVYCAACGEEISRTKVVDAARHTPGDAAYENISNETCTEPGTYDEVVYCSVCGAELSRTHKEKDASGHIPREETTLPGAEASCTGPGFIYRVVFCAVCGEELSRTATMIEPTGHKPGQIKIENETEATCTAGGSYESVVYCSVCGGVISRSTVAVPAKGHTDSDAVVENRTASTCTEAPHYDSVVYCSVCGAEISRKTVISGEPLGHDWPSVSENNGKELLCTRCGKNAISISVRGKTLSYEIDKDFCDDINANGYVLYDATVVNGDGDVIISDNPPKQKDDIDLSGYEVYSGDKLRIELFISNMAGIFLVIVSEYVNY